MSNHDLEAGYHACGDCGRRTQWSWTRTRRYQRCEECGHSFPCKVCVHEDCDRARQLWWGLEAAAAVVAATRRIRQLWRPEVLADRQSNSPRGGGGARRLDRGEAF